jgi:hypothetical protein
MTISSASASASASAVAAADLILRAAVAAYLGRYRAVAAVEVADAVSAAICDRQPYWPHALGPRSIRDAGVCLPGYRPNRNTWRFCVVNGAPGVCYVVAPPAGSASSPRPTNTSPSVDTNQALTSPGGLRS